MLVQAGLCRTSSETTLLVFPRGGSYLYHKHIFSIIELSLFFWRAIYPQPIKSYRSTLSNLFLQLLQTNYGYIPYSKYHYKGILTIKVNFTNFKNILTGFISPILSENLILNNMELSLGVIFFILEIWKKMQNTNK